MARITALQQLTHDRIVALLQCRVAHEHLDFLHHVKDTPITKRRWDVEKVKHLAWRYRRQMPVELVPSSEIAESRKWPKE